MNDDQPEEGILAKLRAADPDRNLAFVAVDMLKTKDEMGRFFGQYSSSLEGAVDGMSGREVAEANLNYVLSHNYWNEPDHPNAQNWEAVLDTKITSPYTGRTL